MVPAYGCNYDTILRLSLQSSISVFPIPHTFVMGTANITGNTSRTILLLLSMYSNTRCAASNVIWTFQRTRFGVVLFRIRLGKLCGI